jgi:hypothetical protein
MTAPEDAIEQRLAELLDGLLQVGTVTGTAVGGKVVVSLRGASVTLPRLKSYTPTTGEAVLVLCVKPGAMLALGSAATT